MLKDILIYTGIGVGALCMWTGYIIVIVHVCRKLDNWKNPRDAR